jgi:hypothetical protein
MHWTLPDLRALTLNEYEGLVLWLREQQRTTDERQAEWA